MAFRAPRARIRAVLNYYYYYLRMPTHTYICIYISGAKSLEFTPCVISGMDATKIRALKMTTDAAHNHRTR